ncbi:MAG: alpha/beta fold hydrolase [Pseudomonadota bacterium]
MARRRLATILSIDVVGYSRMMQNGASPLLAALNQIFRDVVNPEVERANGRVVKLLGDGALVEFGSAGDALESAAAIQLQLAGPPTPYDYSETVLLRMGLHAGDVVSDGGDIFGEGVNIAARLQAEAEPGGILLSRTVADLAGSNVPFDLRGEGARTLKNIDRPVETLSVVLDGAGGDSERADNPLRNPEIRFFNSVDGQSIAWTAVGTGPPIVKAPSWIGNLELDWRTPGHGNVLRYLAGSRRVVFSDTRGNGLSDWDMQDISFDLLVDDFGALFDAAGIERAPIVAVSQGCAIAVAYAARAPERVSALILIGGFPQGRAQRKSQKEKDQAAAMRALMTAGWEDDYPSLRDHFAQLIAPLASREELRQAAEDMREMISPENLGRYREVIDNLDVTGLLKEVEAPCLVMHGKSERMHPVEQGRKLAAGLPSARFIAYDSPNHVFTRNDPCWPLAQREIAAFLEQHAPG